MSEKIKSSLTDADLITHQSYRQVANAATQLAFEEFKVMAKKREAKLIKAAMYYCDSLSEANDFEDAAQLLYEKSGIKELK